MLGKWSANCLLTASVAEDVLASVRPECGQCGTGRLGSTMQPVLVADTKAGLLLAAAFGEAECGLDDMALAMKLALGDAAAALGTAAFDEAAAALGDTAAGLEIMNAALGDKAAARGDMAAALGDMAAALGETAAACKVLPSCMLVGTASDAGDAACICEGITCVSEDLAAALGPLLTLLSEGVSPSSLGSSTCLTEAMALMCCSLLVSLAAREPCRSTFVLSSCLPFLLDVLLRLAIAFRTAFAPLCPAAADFDPPG